jgi:hypothetical protein
VVKVHCDEGVANHIGSEPCVGVREGDCEASVGRHVGQPWSHEIVHIPDADVFQTTEGNTYECAIVHGEDDSPIAPVLLHERMESTAGIARAPLATSIPVRQKPIRFSGWEDHAKSIWLGTCRLHRNYQPAQW